MWYLLSRCLCTISSLFTGFHVAPIFAWSQPGVSMSVLLHNTVRPLQFPWEYFPLGWERTARGSLGISHQSWSPLLKVLQQ